MKQLIFICILSLGLLFTTCVKAQTISTENKVQESITFHDAPKGKTLYGIFEGRSPCDQIAKLLGASLPADLDHLKWQLILYRDSATMKPTTFALTTEMFNRKPLTGKWSILHGTKNSPSVIVYALDWGQRGKIIHLLKGDENVLFILDEKLELLPGNADFSYTLNRVKKVRQLSGQ